MVKFGFSLSPTSSSSGSAFFGEKCARQSPRRLRSSNFSSRSSAASRCPVVVWRRIERNQSQPSTNPQQTTCAILFVAKCNHSQPATNPQPKQRGVQNLSKCNQSQPATNPQQWHYGRSRLCKCNQSQPATNPQPSGCRFA